MKQNTNIPQIYEYDHVVVHAQCWRLRPGKLPVKQSSPSELKFSKWLDKIKHKGMHAYMAIYTFEKPFNIPYSKCSMKSIQQIVQHLGF